MRRRKAFTLVELLVVIGIIAVLIGILLPTLNKAREASKRAACLSNLRELNAALRIYASENNDVCPIGGIAASPSTGSAGTNPDMQYGFTYTVYWVGASGEGIAGLGLLAYSGLLKSGRAFYCQSEEDGQFSFDTPENEWCFVNKAEIQFDGPRRNCRLGYNSRPGAAYTPVHSNAKERAVPLLTDAPYPRAFPRFSKLKNKAIIADVIAYPSAVTRRHKSGINVAYANGSAQWIERRVFDDARYLTSYTWKSIANGSFPVLPHSFVFYHQNSSPTTGFGLWNFLDIASR